MARSTTRGLWMIDIWVGMKSSAVSMLLTGSALTTFSGRPPCCWMRRRAVAAYIGRETMR
jgi:hypothetical protein